jgi:hypothetical protein
MPNSKQYTALTMMLWHHQFKEDESSSLKESINIQISKDISTNPEIHDWKALLDKEIVIPESQFVKFINSETTYRNKDLQDYAHRIMPEL